MAAFMSTVYFEPIYTAREIEYLNDDKTFQTTWSFEGNLKLWSQNWRRITRKYITRTFLIKINIRRYSNNLFYVTNKFDLCKLKEFEKKKRHHFNQFNSSRNQNVQFKQQRETALRLSTFETFSTKSLFPAV